MFLAVSVAWDKGKENTQKHLSRRKKQPTWCCNGYFCKIWYCESMKWPSEQAYLLTELLVLYIHVHSCRTAVLFCILTVYKTNWIIAKQILIKTRERSKFLKNLKTLVTEVLFLILKISAVLESKIPKTNWHSRFFGVLCWWKHVHPPFVVMNFIH